MALSKFRHHWFADNTCVLARVLVVGDLRGDTGIAGAVSQAEEGSNYNPPIHYHYLAG